MKSDKEFLKWLIPVVGSFLLLAVTVFVVKISTERKNHRRHNVTGTLGILFLYSSYQHSMRRLYVSVSLLDTDGTDAFGATLGSESFGNNNSNEHYKYTYNSNIVTMPQK